MTFLTDEVLKYYDRHMYDPTRREFYEYSEYGNFGYWYRDTSSIHDACDNLMEQLLAFIPQKVGKILDVACGKGATTRYLAQYYDRANIIGINISDKQLMTCHEIAPGCVFHKMSATDLQFDNDEFNAVVSVEAAFHFRTRERFLREAYRVLQRGGHIALSDILFRKWAERASSKLLEQNHMQTENDYRALLGRIGFDEIIIRNVTTETLGGFVRYCAQFVQRKLRSGQIDYSTRNRAMLNIYKIMIPAVRAYLLVGARKP